MKRLFLTGLVFLPLLSAAQYLKSSQTAVNFNFVYTDVIDSQLLTFQNKNAFQLSVNDVNVYNPAFYVKDTAFNLAPNQSKSVYIYFKPKHNISHNTEIVAVCDSAGGTLTIDLLGSGRYRDVYYSSTENLFHEDLKAALKTLLAKGYISLGYNGARDKMYMEIDNEKTNGQGANDNTLECVYTGREAVAYTSRSDAQTNHDFNTEHTFPQSFFSEDEPMRSDIHHLFLTDETANNRRSNYPFNYVTNPTWQVGGSKGTSSYFEPRDKHKGNSARALLYFVVRYQDYSSFVKPQEKLLREWCFLDTVDAVERKRNDDIYKYQKNRNPFIDHPEFLERISSLTTTANEQVIYALSLPVTQINFGFVEDSAVYILPFLNTGNQPINLSNIKFKDNTFGAGKTSGIIQPGESFQLNITYKAASQNALVIDTLLANLQQNGQQIKIPVSASSKPVSVSELPNLNDVKIYPQPALQTLYISTPKNALIKAEVYTLIGENVFSQNLNCTSCNLNISNLPAGIYMLKTTSQNGEIVVRKFIKQ